MFTDLARVAHFGLFHSRSFLHAVIRARQEVKSNKLTALADYYATDKGHKKHHYTRIYNDYFIQRKRPVQKLLEIGLLNHNSQRTLTTNHYTSVPSLEMWAKYFPDAEIYGFDKADFRKASGGWTKIIQGDQSSRDALDVLYQETGNVDIIIDDALHASRHQQISFSYLFSKLKEGGAYIIEDLHYQPPSFEDKETPKTVYLLERLQSTGVWESALSTEEEKRYIEQNVGRIRFFDSAFFGISGAKALVIVERREN